MSKKPKVEKVNGIDLSTDNGETVLLWKAKTALSQSEHEQLSERLRYEEEQSGVKIILVPFSVEAEVSFPNLEEKEDTDTTVPKTEIVKEGDPVKTGEADE